MHTTARLVLLALGALSAPAYAGVYCVNDVASLDSALSQSAGNGANNEIDVVRGTYALDAAVFYGGNTGHALRVLGGYAPNTACDPVQRAIAPANTVLDASGAPGQFSFNSNGGDILIEGLRFTKLTAASGSALRLNHLDGYDGVTITFRFNEVDHASSPTAALELIALNELEFSTSLVHDNTAPDAVLVDGDSWLVRGARIVHNTITKNSGVGLHTKQNWKTLPLGLYNNILYGNAAAGLHVSTRSVYALNNTISSVVSDVAQTYVNGSSGNVSSNPNLAVSTFAPLPGSPAINSGNTFSDVLPAQDIAGVPRVFGSAPDRGAFEAVNGDYSVFQVTNTHDSGAGSLRAAIHSANQSAGPSLITFNITNDCATNGPAVIAPGTAFEDIVVPLTINGYSQPGALRNTQNQGFNARLCVALYGGGTIGIALRVPSGAVKGRLDVSGLLFSYFSTYAVALANGTGHHIHGNSFGVTALGTGTVFPNGANLIINGSAQAAVIGGAALADRNLFGGAYGIGTGLNISSADCYCVVRNVYIGTDASGAGTSANTGTGLQIYGSQHNLIRDNVISGNDGAGVQLVSSPSIDTAYNTLWGNRIGVAANGSSVIGNGFAGVWVSTTAQYNDIGGSAYWDQTGSNIIAGSNGPGVLVDSTAGIGNSVFGDRIRTNSGIAIDLDAQGPLANDTLDADAGPNGLQNYPVITRAISLSPLAMHVEGFLAGAPSHAYYINIYANAACDVSGFGPAQIPVGGFLTLIAGPSGYVAFSVDVGASLFGMPSSGVVTATATDTSFSTSEISACHPYIPDEIFPDDFETVKPPSK